VRARNRQVNGLAVTKIGLALFLLLGEIPSISGDCGPPHYKTGRVLEDSKAAVAMYISIPVADFAPQRLVCLAEALKRRYPNRALVFQIFDDHSAAKRLPVPRELFIEDVPWINRLTAHRHAEYYFDPARHEDWLLLLPDPLKYQSRFNTRIDLPISGPPNCKLGLNGRCLLVLPYVDEPWGDIAHRFSGAVTLAGTIARDGRIRSLRVASARVNPSEFQRVLTLAAVRNLESWRFEPSKQEDALQATYSYRLVSSVGRTPPVLSPQMNVRIELGDKRAVTVELTLLKR
jgi:hypothetical protein